MELEAYRQFTENLKNNLEADVRVLGLIALGSMAEVTRLPDDWSDHDFFVITESGEQEHLRTDVSWLPYPERIVLNIRETAHGLKILYDDAHLLEFAVFDINELKQAHVNDYRILIDKAGLDAIVSQRVTDTLPIVDTRRDVSMVLALLFVGAGRYARGEHLSAHLFIKTYALYHLLPLLRDHLMADDISRLDTLDPIRRFEQVFPEVGAEISQIMLLPILDAAQGILNLVDRLLRDTMPDYPKQAFEVVSAYIARLKT
jgi:lincosamide nucleotidyltransferase B/F